MSSHGLSSLCIPNISMFQFPLPRRAAVGLDYSHLTSLFELHRLCQNLMFWYRHALAFWELELQCLNLEGKVGVQWDLLQNPVSPPQHRWLSSSGSSEFGNELTSYLSLLTSYWVCDQHSEGSSRETVVGSRSVWATELISGQSGLYTRSCLQTKTRLS